MRRAALSLSALLWLANFVFAGDKPEFGPVPLWVQPTVLRDADTARDDAPVNILLTDWQVRFGLSTVEAYFGSLTRVQTPQGLQAVGTVILPWNPAIDVLTVHRLHIVRGDQTIDVLAGGQTFTVLRRENSLEYAALDGVLTAVIQPAGLQVGDTIDIAFSITRSDPVLAGVSEWTVGGWPNAPISHIRVRGAWSAPEKMRWKASDSMTTMGETRRGDMTEVTAALDDVSPLSPQKGAPARYRIGRQIEFSSFNSWTQVAERLAPLYARASILAPQSGLNAEVARIRASSTDRRSQAMAALALVQDQVRYVFLGMNDGALVPADADLTWSRRFGDCKGKTALLLALLHALDIHAEPVAVNTLVGDSIKSGLPMIGAFNHVLVRASVDGKVYWLDGAGSGDRRVDELIAPAYYWGLPLVSKGDLVAIIPTPPSVPTDETSIQIDASAGIPGTARVHATTVLRGRLASNMRFALGSLVAKDRDRGLREFWSNALDSVTIENVEARYDEEAAKEYLTMDGSTSLNWSDGRRSVDWIALRYGVDLSRPEGQQGDAPFAVPFPSYSRVTETIKLPRAESAFWLEGDDIDRTIVGAEFRRKLRIEDGVLTAEASVRTLVPEIASAGVKGEQEALRDVTESLVYLHAPASYLRSRTDGGQMLYPAPGGPLAALMGDDGPMGVELFDKEKSDQLISEGNRALDRGELNHAIEEFDKALQFDPMAAMALADRGMARLWKGETKGAAVDFDAAFAIDVRNPVVPRGRGILAMRAGSFTDAITEFTRSLDLEANNEFALSHRAEAYREAGDTAHALADAAAAIKVAPGSIDEYVFRATILRERNEIDDAMKEADAVVRANAGNPLAYVAAARICRSLGRDAEAMHSLERSLAVKPTANAYLTRASYTRNTDFAATRADIDAALRLEPRSLPALFMLASIQSDNSEFDGALATLEKAVSIYGETPKLLTLRGIARAKNHQQDLAQKDFVDARRKATEPDAMNDLCWSMATAGVALETALDTCEAAIALRPTEPEFLDSRGFVLLRLGRYDDAIASYDTALNIRPRLGMSLYGRGLAKRLKGDRLGGDADMNLALVLDGHVAGIFAQYGLKP
jgi:tetratricopeptide (TPR) repeat protein/transglutaminase-like putative cysteine protease